MKSGWQRICLVSSSAAFTLSPIKKLVGAEPLSLESEASEIGGDGSNAVLHDLGVGSERARVRRKGDLRVELKVPGVSHLAKQRKGQITHLVVIVTTQYFRDC